MPRPLLFAAVAALLAGSLSFGGARAADLGGGLLTPTSGSVTWAGEFHNASTPGPEACVVEGACDEFDLTVALPEGYWTSTHHGPGAVQIGIRWWTEETANGEPESAAEYDDIDLYVYDDTGALVASSVNPVRSSAGIASTAQVVDLPEATNGDYRVLMVPANVADRDYEGLAMIQSYAPPVDGDLLPDLVSQRPTNFRLEIGTYSLSRNTTDARSCYVEETLQDPDNPERCLRFDAGHANLGDGPLEFEMRLDSAEPAPDDQGFPTLTGDVVQVIHQSTGTRRPLAGKFAFHPNHGHVHYKAFAEYLLYLVNDGARTGDPIKSKKSDFCMIDVSDLWFGLQGNMPRTHHFPQCNTADEGSFEDGIVQHQGINRGWADVYTWDLPGQYIDITNLDDGIYDVVNTANPLGSIEELPGANDEAATRIRISGNVITCIPVNDPRYGNGTCPPGTPPEPAA